jgi:hypothetical protein
MGVECEVSDAIANTGQLDTIKYEAITYFGKESRPN